MTNSFIRGRFVAVPVALAFFLSLGLAQATGPKLNSITPAGGQRGSELEVKFSGARLHDAKDIIFYSPGFNVRDLDTSRTNSIRAQIKIAEDCPLGEHFLRVRTATGVSELRSFYVGAYTNITEAEPNNEMAKAQPIPYPCTVNGSTGQEDIDFYEVSLEKGQRLSAEIEAMRLGRTMLDPYLAIRAVGGKVLASADDTTLLLQDATASVVAPETGKYVIEVRETSYSGAAGSAYRLHIGSFPRPLAVFPTGGQTGETMRVKFLADVEGDLEQEIKLPETPAEKIPVFAKRGSESTPSPNWLRVSAFPNVLEEDLNHSQAQATRSEFVPVAFNGIVAREKEVDWFCFRGKKGEPLEINVFARRLRSPLDSVIEIRDAKGKTLAQNDDASGPDSALKFSPPEDGDYFLTISDQLSQGAPHYVYRVEVTLPKPSLAFSIPQVARNDSQTRQAITVPRGNRFATLIAAKRGSFSGPLQIDVPDLPAGVFMAGEMMAAKQDQMPVVFEASEEAPLAGKLLELRGVSTNGIAGGFRQDVEFIYGQNNQVYYGARVDRLMVAVTEAAPFKVQILEPHVPLVQSGTMDLRIAVARTQGFEEPISLKMLWNPPGVSSQPEITLAKGATNIVYPLNAAAGAEIQKWKIAVIGTATVDGGPVYASSQLAEIAVSEPYLTGKIDTLTMRPGEKTKLNCKLDQKIPFEGKAVVKLVGLPDKVTASTSEITKNDKEVSFEIVADPDCQPKSTRVLFCSVAIQKDGELVPHNIASGGHLRIAPPKKSAGTDAARVASKTEKSR